MATALQPTRGSHASPALRRPPAVSPLTLQQRYVAATQSFGPYFAQIDAWLVEHEPHVWQHLHQADDELFQLSQIGVSEHRYQAALEAFITLCEEAEQHYYEAHPTELSLPPLAAGEQAAVYYQLSNGSMLKVTSEDE